MQLAKSDVLTAMRADANQLSSLPDRRVLKRALSVAISEELCRPVDEWQQDTIALGWLATSILHDLRNPLSAITAAAEILNDVGTLPAEAKRLATNIHRAAGRVQELLTDLTTLIRRDRPAFEVCELRQIMGEASAAASDALPSKTIEIVFDVSADIQLPLQRSRMKRVFFNLMVNAFEALAGGGALRIGAKIADKCVLIVLEDTGPGIPRRLRERLFEPFTTTGKEDGWGLGLALSRQAIVDHGGEIWTEPAAGCRFVISLPLKRDPHC
jgi:signal transduction histidine kinase